MEINNSELRIAHFTSSQIYRLCGTPAVSKTYIGEVKMEKLMGRAVKTVVKTLIL